MVRLRETPEEKHARLLLMERETWSGGALVAGLDEAGVGPLAGPVVAACVILDPRHTAELVGVNDSKALSAAKRAELEQLILKYALEVRIGVLSEADVDRLNPFYAGVEAMQLAYTQLTTLNQQRLGVILIDGPHRRLDAEVEQCNVIKGDAKSLSIAAASIVAKETRDRIMLDYAAVYPEYGFQHHKGYSTHAHLEALRKHGPCPIHRKTYAPVKALLRGTDAEHQANDSTS